MKGEILTREQILIEIELMYCAYDGGGCTKNDLIVGIRRMVDAQTK